MSRIIYHCIEPEAHNSLHVHLKKFENVIICFEVLYHCISALRVLSQSFVE